MPANLKLVELEEDAAITWCSIFNHYRYYELHKTKSSIYFALVNTNTNAISGVCHFTETENKTFVSPYRGTFAGPELKENNSEELAVYLQALEGVMKKKGARQIVFTSAPIQYHPFFSEQLVKAATSAGYAILKDEPCYVMEVNGEDFAKKINRNHQRLLKKCFTASFVFQQVFIKDEMQQVYNIIAANRQHKGYEISMTLEQIMQMLSAFPDSLYFFSASFNTTATAAAICIRIDADVLYVFYWGDLPGYEPYSPITFIANGIYNFARENRFKLLDVGGASLHGQPITGLIQFKESLGFAASSKLTYAKSL